MIDTPEQIAAILQREYDAADSYYEQIEELQKQAFDYYEGKPLGTEVEGRSQIVLPDVQTAIDYMVHSRVRRLGRSLCPPRSLTCLTSRGRLHD